MVANVLQDIRKRDERWIAIAKDHLRLPAPALRGGFAHVDNFSLYILIHMTRYVIRTHSDNWSFLSSLSDFDICDTLPEMQNEICTLWNQIVLEERKKLWSGYGIDVLGEIREVYVALHQDTDGATIPDASRTTSYPIPHWLSFHPLCVITQTRLFLRPPDLLTPMIPPLIHLALKPRLSVAPPHTMQKKQTSSQASCHPQFTSLMDGDSHPHPHPQLPVP